MTTSTELWDRFAYVRCIRRTSTEPQKRLKNKFSSTHFPTRYLSAFRLRGMIVEFSLGFPSPGRIAAGVHGQCKLDTVNRQK